MHTAKPLKGLSVLVVEDAYLQAVEMQQVLQDAGAVVLGPFHAADAALTAFDPQHTDCALVDIKLGGEPSFACASAVVQAGVPIVFVTGYCKELAPSELTGCAWLEKPAKPSAIVAAVLDAARFH